MTEPDELEEGQFHPDNPVFARKLQPRCNECGGLHDSTGAWRDCLNHWKLVAGVNSELVTIAQNLLTHATPNTKFLNDSEQVQWANDFGKWWSSAYPRPAISNFMSIFNWLNAGTYRILMHRHNDTFRAIDQSEARFLDADTVEELSDLLKRWGRCSKSTSGQYLNLSQV